jgi:hypothetical protein
MWSLLYRRTNFGLAIIVITMVIIAGVIENVNTELVIITNDMIDFAKFWWMGGDRALWPMVFGEG